MESLLLASSSGVLVLIWLVQLVIYPAFAAIAPERFAAWHGQYTWAVSWVVMPLMLTQVVGLALLLWWYPTDPWLLAAGVGVLAAWLLTFFWAVPCHRRLEKGFDAVVAASLLRANSWRCLAWSAVWVLVLGRLLGDW